MRPPKSPPEGGDYVPHGHRRARIIRNRDVPAGQAAEDDALTDIRLAGQRDAALNHYQHCRQVLAAELNLEPEPETTLDTESVPA